MKILLAYIATANYLRQLEETLQHQLEFPEWVRFDKLVVSDTRMPWSIPLASKTINPWVSGQFCISKARNAAIQHAASQNYDWLAVVDADAIIPRFPTVFPDSGFARINLYRTRENETASELWADPTKHVRLQRAWCLLGQKLFDRRFLEQFLSSGGFEQIDFLHNVMHDVSPGATDIAAIHLWHPTRWKSKATDRDRDLFTTRFRQFTFQ